MAMEMPSTMRPAGWSGELQDLQEETIRLLHTIRGGSDSRRQQSPGGRASRGGGTIRPKRGDTPVAEERSTIQAGINPFRKRRRKKRARNYTPASTGHGAGLGVSGSKRFSYTLDTTQWPGEGRGSEIPTSELDIGKTTVEVLDRGEETPRSPPFSGRPVDAEGQPRDSGGADHSGKHSSSPTSKTFQAAGPAADGDEEGRFRHLAFKDEEGRVRDGTDRYVAGHAGLGYELKRLRAERDRLASIENAQRETCCGAKREEFLRFARRKWLKSDRAAEHVQRLFRGYIGRRRVGLAKEVRRLTGQARAEWVEVRDRNRGEAWYFNPLTGISQWERPDSLLGTMTPLEKVRTLPALEPRSPSKKRPLAQKLEVTTGFEPVSERKDKPSPQPNKGMPNASPIKSSTAETSGPGGSVDKIDSTAVTAAVAAAHAGASDIGMVQQTAPCLPPLTKGSSRAVLDRSPPREFAPSSGLGGELDLIKRGTGGEKKWRDRQHAWVRGGAGDEVEEEEEFPFLVEEEVLVDDRFEETGLGLARRKGEEEEEENEAASCSSDDSKDRSNGAKGFFLADGTPNIRLRRTIAKALRVTKFDSVSTLLSDYTGRNLAAATTQNRGSRTATYRTAPPNDRERRATTASAGGGGSSGGGGGRSNRKRHRTANNAIKVAGNPESVGGTGVDRTPPFPTGKLEQDKHPPLFPSSAGGGGGGDGGRRMVSLMTASGKKSGSAGEGGGSGGGARRVKTGGVKKTGDRGNTLKGLAIRDLTPPGFLPPPGAKETDPNPPPPKPCGESGGGTADAGALVNGEDTGDTGIGAKQAGEGVSAGKEIGMGRAAAAAATVIVEKTEATVKEVCFNCWSKGSGKTCTLHTGGPRERGGGGGAGAEAGGKADGQARQAESALMCKNWDVGVMRRRYRSEELQEVFAKEASSLRYDKERKTFVSIVEQRHPIYRLLAKIIAGYNFTVRRKMHQKNWMRGFVEQLRMGKVAGASAAEVNKTAKILRLRNTTQNLAQVSTFTAAAKATQPKPPVTGSTLAERLGLVRVLVDRPSMVMKRVTKVILDGPTPLPVVLYEARRYPLPLAKTMPMPEPKYLDTTTEDDLKEPSAAPVREQRETSGKTNESRSAWMVLLCAAAAGEIVRSAVANVEVRSPVPGADDIARTKYPPALTIKFATFSRKPTPGMMAVGGLPAEMVVHMLVSTRMPPQYGNFTVMQKSSIAPTVSKERSAEYKSLELLVENQVYLLRELLHPLNSRKAPTVTLKTLMDDPGNRHYFGLNRPEQTGEADAHGFRTSSHADTVPALPTLDPTAFTPSEEVVTPNLCSANRTVTTHADRSYPFCEPSNRSNTTLDFYHLLLTATCSPNKEQVFTNLGVQECGEFMRGSDAGRPMGHCIGVVYRSWAFLQRQILEEFETDDGVPYWFDRRTGETFWERPLCDEEKMPVKEGGTILGGQGEPPDTSSGAFEDIKPRYDQQEMRKLMMKSHEGTEALERRRKQVATQVKWARSSGALPAPDPRDLKPSTPRPTDECDDDDQLEPEGGDSITALVATGTSSGGEPSLNSSSSKRSDPRCGSISSPPNGSPNGRQGRGGQDRTSANSSGGNGSPVGRGRVNGSGQESRRDTANGRSKADRLAASIAEALKEAGLSEGRSVKPSDMLRLGMGLGISLGANGLLNELDSEGGGGAQGADGRGGRRADAGGGQEVAAGREASLAPPVVKDSASGHPIGHGHAEPIAEKQECAVLDHESEAQHLASIVRGSTDLKTSDEFKGLLVVPPAKPSASPDESYKLVRPEDMELDPRRKAELAIPIVAYPETLWKKQYRGHGGAGEGESWQPAGGDRAENQRAKSSRGVPMRRTNEPLPEGFLNAISHTHVGKQHCDYLPHVPNMPQARAVGRVKPRSAAEDWFAVGFDPWSAGREPLSAEFIPTLSIKQEDLGADEEGGGISTVPQAGYLELKDATGHAEMAIVSAEEAKMASDFEQITSWARHARYADVETAMNQADWTMPIDYQNELGVTLLHVAAQNGNKRIAKLCLRKGADVNKCNNNGQTPLHYAYGYGFESFGEYLISKGADDSIVNADGLTCYEGLSKDNLGQL